MYRGDFRLGDTVDLKFCTVNTGGTPTTLAGTPTVAAYPANSTTEITAGITLTVDFDARTGLNHVRVAATNGNGYAAGTHYELVLTAGSVGASSVAGYVIGSFSIENRSAIMPTTAGRTLDVSSGGEAGVDWANVGSPTTVQALTSTTIGTVNSVAANGISATSLATDTITAAKIANGAIDRATFAPDTGLMSFRSGAAQAGSSSDITLDASASSVDNFYIGALIVLTQSTGVGQARLCTAYNGTTKVATIDPAWATAPDGTTQFAIMPFSKLIHTVVQTNQVDLLGIDAVQGFSIAAGAISSTSLANNTITAAKIASSALTAAKFATDAIDSNALAANAIAEIWNQVVSEPAGVPAINAPVLQILAWLLALSRNKITQTATTQTVRNDADNATIASSTHSDDGTTHTRGEFS